MMKNTDSLVEIQVHVEPGARGLRADIYLARHLGRISRSRILAMFKAERVFLEERPIRASHRLRGGEILVLHKPAPLEKSLPPVEVMYQDTDLVVVNKPGDLTVHPTANAVHRTLTAFLKTLDAGPYTPAHRLDRETSGIVACARTGAPSSNLKEQFASRHTQKIYLAIVRGVLRERLEVAMPLGFDTASPIRIKMTVTGDGAPAHSSFVPLLAGDNATLVLAIPHTGRQHQLRAHLEWAGFPLAGDKIYGVPPEYFLRFIKEGWTAQMAQIIFERHMLHAAFLSIHHPVTGERMTFLARPPDDFIRACQQLGIQIPDKNALDAWLADACRQLETAERGKTVFQKIQAD